VWARVSRVHILPIYLDIIGHQVVNTETVLACQRLHRSKRFIGHELRLRFLFNAEQLPMANIVYISYRASKIFDQSCLVSSSGSKFLQAQRCRIWYIIRYAAATGWECLQCVEPVCNFTVVFLWLTSCLTARLAQLSMAVLFAFSRHTACFSPVQCPFGISPASGFIEPATRRLQTSAHAE